jgi:hypothetical protein
MNQNLPPLSPEHVDELLSAELDGEFDAAAVDLGFEPAQAAALLAATEGVDVRRRQLGAARDLLADVPELDELTSARLQTAAASAATESDDELSRARRRRAWTRVAGIAAALVAVLGIAAIANNNSSGKSKQVATASGAKANRSLAPTSSPLIAAGALDFGTAPDVAALGDRVRDRLHVAAKTQANAAALPTELTTGADANTNFSSADKAAHAFRAPCDGAARRSVDATSAPVLAGAATLDQTPVTVFVYRRGSVYVLAASDAGCTVIAHRVLGP